MVAVLNGQLPASLLVPAAGRLGARLRVGTAGRWAWVRAQVTARYGWTPEITSAGDGYRSLELQTATFLARYDHTWRSGLTTSNGGIKFWQGKTWYRKPGMATAAVPGTSNHGLGKAVDVTGLGGFGTTRFNQFALVAAEAGFSNAEGQPIGEHWHWVDQHDPDVTTVSNTTSSTGAVPSAPDTHVPDPIEEDDMYTDDDRANAAELRRFNGVLAGALAPGNENEARLVARLKALDSLERILANTDEDRRMLGVTLGWQPAQGPEVDALKKLWGVDEVPGSLDPAAIAKAVVAALGPELARQVAERLTVTVKS